MKKGVKKGIKLKLQKISISRLDNMEAIQGKGNPPIHFTIAGIEGDMKCMQGFECV